MNDSEWGARSIHWRGDGSQHSSDFSAGGAGQRWGTLWDWVSIGKVTLTRAEVGERGGSAAQGSARRGWVCCGWVLGGFFSPPPSSVRMVLVRPRLRVK